MEMPLLGMGTWGMGGKYERDESNYQESVKILRYGLELGFRLIDTAELYGQGLTEETVGEAIKDTNRLHLFLVSKVWKNNLRYPDVIRSAENSLRRLKIDYLDLYLIHWPNDQIPLGETIQAMEHLAEQGMIRQIGVSNFDTVLLKEAQRHLRHFKLAANQIEYNLAERSAEDAVIPYCCQNNIRVIAYRPLARGLLAEAKNDLLSSLSQKYNKTPAQVSLNWIISQGFTAIPKASAPEHLKENYGALGWNLEEKDMRELDKLKFRKS